MNDPMRELLQVARGTLPVPPPQPRFPQAGRTLEANEEARRRGFADINEPFYGLNARTRLSGPNMRRRRWSDFKILVNTNLPLGPVRRQYGAAVANAQRTILERALALTITDIFNNPINTYSFMRAVNSIDRRHGNRPLNYADAGDRFDDTHVFDNQYWFDIETGPASGMVHAVIIYRVLHDSNFWVDHDSFTSLLKSKWPEMIQRVFDTNPALATLSESRPVHFLRTRAGRPRYPYVISINGYSPDRRGAAYDAKGKTDIYTRARWTSRRLGARPQSSGAQQQLREPEFPQIG